ncbi:Sec14 domain containing protein [Cryptosporidium hominis]|uniref:Sec14 domain containing protein n=2 Tax=Cryptosporidium hominis TaxID=237895 RepID=A0ABX5B8J0_CRYHO|nr:Sec14 domain containing protein [Cryptosporidium hominis]|eukprot:PPS92809.1 Sec14 domain containing protein [Cryptosporidium hominis]
MHKSKSLDNYQEWDNKLAEGYEYSPLIITEKISEYTMPSEILLYNPTEDDIFTKFHAGSSNEFKIRQIFLHVDLLEQEEEMLIEFDNFLTKNCIKLPEFMKPLILRVLMFNKRRHPNTYIQRSMNHLISMFKWRVSTYPLSDMESTLREDLESGIIYWHGRDYCLRPILTIRLSKVNKHFPLERFIRLIVFCMEWGMRYLMCPGKVETCLALIDVKGVSLTSFPISTMSEISSLLTNQYSFRLYRMFILHDSLFIQTVWSLMKQFLTDLQQHKIVLSRNEIKTQLFKTVHPNQVEEHFGGLQRNKTFPFYPFIFPSGPFSDPKLHPNNGFTRVVNQCNIEQMDNFSKVTNCHLLFNKFNVLGKLYYNGNKHNKILWDEKGLKELNDIISSFLNINLDDDKKSFSFDKNSNHLNSNIKSANNHDHYYNNNHNYYVGNNNSNNNNSNHHHQHQHHHGNNNNLHNSNDNFPINEILNSDRKNNNDDIEQIEKLELKSYLMEHTDNMKLDNLTIPNQKIQSTNNEDRDLSAEINIGIINTINMNTDIANIGDMSQHFIREYSVLSESPNLAENIAMIIEDSQSFFSASSSLYINEDNDENPYVEDFHHNLIIDNPCCDHNVFQSFGVLPIAMESFKNSGKKSKSCLKSSNYCKNSNIVNEENNKSNLINTYNSKTSNNVILNNFIEENGIINNKELSNQTKSLKDDNDKNKNNKNNINDNSSYVISNDILRDYDQIVPKRSNLSLSSPIIDINPPVSALNTSSSRISSMENTKLNDSFSYIGKSHESQKISKKSKIKSKIFRVINKIKNRTSIIENE